jgi:predicted permease
MRLPDRVRALFGALFGRNRLDRRIEEEIAFHIEARTRNLTASGLHPDEAARRARAEFGGSVQVREECREARGAWISRIADHVFRDVRFTLRTFRRSPGTLSVAVLTLSLGVAATTAMYSAVDGVLLEPLPYPDPDRMVWVWSVETDTGMRVRASFPDFSDWRRDGTTLDLAGWGGYSPILTGAGNPERLTAALVMGDFFELLGVRPALGVFEELDTIRDEEPSVVLSHGIWEERFGSDPGIVGQPMTLDDTAYIVSGVMPADFRFPIHARPEVDIWVPLARFNPVLANQRGARLIEVIGRIRPGASLEAARSEMVAIAVGLSETFPDTNRGIGIELVPAIDEVTGGVSRGLWILFAASTGLLLIACVNVANILLARASGREREFRIRGALGAGRARVSLQLVVEGILISVGGGFMACLLAYGSIDVLAALIPVEVPRADRIALDARVLTLALAASLATGLSFSMAPVLQVWRRAGAPRARRDHGEHRMRAALIVSETALATILLTASGLLVQTFVRLNQSDTGFAPANVLTFEVDLPSGRYPRPAEAFRDLQSRLMDIPGVVVASTGLQLPDRGIPMIDDVAPAMIEVDATPLPEAERRRVSVLSTQPGYFRALGVPLLAGRDFWAGDSSDAPRVAIINESLAATYFAAQDPIGRRITLDSWTLSGERSARVVGVSGNVAHRSLTAPVQGYVYLPLEQRPQ